MSLDAITDEAAAGQSATAAGEPPASDASVLQDAQLLWHELRVLAHDHLQLVALETQRAGKSLIDMLVAGVMVAILLIGTWLGFMAGAVLWLTEHGFMPSSAILIGTGLNIAIAAVLYGIISYKSRYLKFPATVRSIHPQVSRTPE